MNEMRIGADYKAAMWILCQFQVEFGIMLPISFPSFPSKFHMPMFCKLSLNMPSSPRRLQMQISSMGLEIARSRSSGPPRGETPLHWAAMSGHGSVVERLLAAGAAVDARNRSGCGLRADFRFRAGQMGKGPTERDVGDEGLWKWIKILPTLGTKCE